MKEENIFINHIANMLKLKELRLIKINLDKSARRQLIMGIIFIIQAFVSLYIMEV
jgi:hypothetical protein